MRFIRSLAVAAAVLLLAACTSTAQQPASPPPDSASAVEHDTCLSPTVTVLASGKPAMIFVAARLRDHAALLAGEPGVAVWDQPITSTLNWDSDAPWLTDENVAQELARSAPVTEGQGISEVDTFMKTMTGDHTLVGYIAENVRVATVQIVCSQG